MKTEFVDISDTEKNLVFEISSDVVDAEIERVALNYRQSARIPGFRRGKVPKKIVRQRFRDQILHDVAHELIPRAVDDALRERGLEPIETPSIRDGLVKEGEALTFTACFETVPPIDLGDYGALSSSRPSTEISDNDIEQAFTRLRDQAARFDPVEDRPVQQADSVILDLTRQVEHHDKVDKSTPTEPERHEDIAVEIGASINPPGFDKELLGLEVGATKEFTLSYPMDYTPKELAGVKASYSVTIKAIKSRVVPELDDEFAKDIGPFDSLGELREQIVENLQRESEEAADQQVRANVLKQMSGRAQFEVPEVLVKKETDRRVEELARRLIQQQVDPMKANINWEEFREQQHEPAIEAVRSALVLDEIARRENLTVDDTDIDREVARYAERAGRTPAALRARLEKEGGLHRLQTSVRREKAVDFLLSRTTIATA
ncbi:MAG TPA: trigger factor [Acidobacteria bacterium]|nr:trigger factor [Acidobacteriota bacterium]